MVIGHLQDNFAHVVSSDQKWFLRPYFPLIRGMFLLRSGLRFSLWALEVPEPKVRKGTLSLKDVPFFLALETKN